MTPTPRTLPLFGPRQELLALPIPPPYPGTLPRYPSPFPESARSWLSLFEKFHAEPRPAEDRGEGGGFVGGGSHKKKEKKKHDRNINKVCWVHYSGLSSTTTNAERELTPTGAEPVRTRARTCNTGTSYIGCRVFCRPTSTVHIPCFALFCPGGWSLFSIPRVRIRARETERGSVLHDKRRACICRAREPGRACPVSYVSCPCP